MADKNLSRIPGVDRILNDPELRRLRLEYSNDLVTSVVRQILAEIRTEVQKQATAVPGCQEIVESIKNRILSMGSSSLKTVINATGIILHTNLSRAPLGKKLLAEITTVLTGYSNLELNLETGRRGHRHDHILRLLQFVTGAEAAAVVNNNAAAVMLCLHTLAAKKEVLVSRGELIEIGGSFRIPEIMKASGARMVEVGTTNRTRLSDFESAITEKTRVIFKAHKSNFAISGFTEEADTSELADLAHKYNLIMIYDLGSGLLRKPEGMILTGEPDVRSSLESGADLITFSGDKLLGGPQAGIILGRQNLVDKISKAPLMRALRVDKFTIAALSVVLSWYRTNEMMQANIPIFGLLKQTAAELRTKAEKLQKELQKININCEIVASSAQVGGGTLPGQTIPSYAVRLLPPAHDKKFAAGTFHLLLQGDNPVLGILREGNLLLDIMTVNEREFSIIADRMHRIMVERIHKTKKTEED